MAAVANFSLLELLRDVCRGALGAGEHDGGAPATGLEDAGQQLDLVEGVRPVDHLLDGGHRLEVSWDPAARMWVGCDT